jgi:hypothetical protein
MANSFIKATKVVNTALGLLQREVVLPNLVWRDAVTDFAGAVGDTVTVRVPAYMTARTRTLRAAGPLVMDDLAETSVPVQLTTDVYKGINVTDENMELDITDFGAQVLNPQVQAVAVGVEDALSDAIAGATYSLTGTFSEATPLKSVLVARKQLNKAHVPAAGRTLLVGAEIEQIILEALAGRESGAQNEQSALNDATVAFNFGGFRVVQSAAIDPDKAYAFHKTAFILSSHAPRKPDGCTWGATASYAGLAMRVIKDYDPLYIRDRCIANVWIGADVVYDNGELNKDGQFVPFDTEAEIGSGTPILVRAVELTLGS